MARRETPEINAGSMADIAFLLLIFFLVTTTMDVDSGIARKLPEKPPPGYVPPILKEKNVFEVNINRNNQFLVEGEYMNIDQIKEAAKKFINNGGGTNEDGEECTWCTGERDPRSSDHPSKAIISIQSDRATNYGPFIAVQNELEAAYTELRNELGLKLYGKTFTALVKDLQNDKKNEELKEKIENIKNKYPQIISEAEPTQ
ncbi:MAG: biopolymer transporter ExbD [Flavobacteriaceae bacterium]|nr:biopolymer transporter ExbD [Flavobacteriaceae bacterium]